MSSHRATVAFLGAAPAGPSPLAVRDAPPIAEPVGLPLAPPSQFPLTKKQLTIGGIAMLGLIVLIAIIASVAGGKSTSQSAVIDAAVAAPPNNPVDDELARATELVAAGRSDAAIEQLVAARRRFPKDARLAYLAGKTYFDTQRWSNGLKQFREVLVLDPTYRSDPELIKTVLKAFLTPADYPADLGAFLRNDIGPPAKQYLEETIATHPRAATRARAKAELQRMP